MRLFIFLCMATLLSSCGKFADGTSVWGGGLFALPWATGLAAAYFGWQTWKQYKSGSWKTDDRWKTKKDGSKMPLYQLSNFWFASGFLVLTLVIIIVQNASK